MRPRDTIHTLPDEEVRSAMYRARKAGREARQDGRDGEAALWTGLLKDLTLERRLRELPEHKKVNLGGVPAPPSGE